MNATSRSLPQVDEDEQLLRANQLIALLFDALVHSYRFSVRERAILRHVLLGRSSAAIARRLGLRESTIHKHMHSIFARTGTDGRQRLHDLALRLAAQLSVAQPRGLAMAA